MQKNKNRILGMECKGFQVTLKSCLMGMIVLFISSLLTSCGSNESPEKFFQPHIGQWSGIDSAGTKATILFREEGTGTISFSNQVYDFEYLIDYTKKPIWLDLIYTREGGPYRAKLILKFMGNNSLKWRTFFNDQRPEEFPEDDLKNTTLLTRDNPVSEV